MIHVQKANIITVDARNDVKMPPISLAHNQSLAVGALKAQWKIRMENVSKSKNALVNLEESLTRFIK